METLNKIKKERMAARKAKDTAAITSLTTLQGELDTMAKKVPFESDDQVVAVVRKFVSSITDTISALKERGQDTSEQEAEIALLQQFLPQQMSEESLTGVIEGIVEAVGATSMRDMGKVMAELKAQYPNKFDGGMASMLVKGILG
jgi:uncharacterized protein YqeY